MRSSIVLALAASALAVPYNKREVVTEVDVVYATDVVTVWANANNAATTTAAQPSSTSSVEVAADESSSPAPQAHYGHNHWGHSSWDWESSTSSAAPTTTPTSTYVPPAPVTTSTSTPAPPPPAPTTTSSSTPPPPPPAPTTTSWAAPPPPATTSSSSSSTWAAPSATAQPAKPTSYAEIVTYHHNLHRNNHSAPDIAWDDGLASIAASIAATCKYGHVTNVSGGGYGQNIAAGVESANISSIITDLFYNGEVGWYDGLYNQDQPDMTNFEHWGHFSQIVWVGTTHVGCATQYCTGTDGLENVGTGVLPYFTVCNYKDPGNFAGEYGKNVLQSKGQPTVGWDAGL